MPAAEARQGYDDYQIGNVCAARPGATEAALVLMGGGEWSDQAFVWLVAKRVHGHFVILRAPFGDDLQNELFTEVDDAVSVQTLVSHNREAASDPAVLDIVRRADANVIRLWPSATLRVRFMRGPQG